MYLGEKMRANLIEKRGYMPYVNNYGVKTYYELEGEGPPLVLAHGGGQSLEEWRRLGYAEALKSDFKLLLFDARGHGRSDKPHEVAAYGPIIMADDVVTLLDDIGIKRCISSDTPWEP